MKLNSHVNECVTTQAITKDKKNNYIKTYTLIIRQLYLKKKCVIYPNIKDRIQDTAILSFSETKKGKCYKESVYILRKNIKLIELREFKMKNKYVLLFKIWIK